MPQVSIVIVTRNRPDFVMLAIESALAQDGDAEVIAIDDASDTDVAGAIRDRFPSIRVERSTISQGVCGCRNWGIEMSRSPYVITLDDDATFTSPTIALAAVREFTDERIGIVTLPLFNDRNGEIELCTPKAPDDGKTYVVRAFFGSAACFRRDLFLKLGGYQRALHHWGEESEFSLRLLDAGYLIKVGRGDSVRHTPAPTGRDPALNPYLYRNTILASGLRFPWWSLPGALTFHTMRGVVRGARSWDTFKDMTRGICSGYRSLWTYRALRRPISGRTYRLYQRLRKSQMLPLDAVMDQLPVRQTSGSGIGMGLASDSPNVS